MHTNVNLFAPIGAMALLGTGFLFLVVAVCLIQSLIVRKFRRAKFMLAISFLIAGVYLAALLIFSMVSQEKVLARGEEKHFCELDCHLAYSVTNSRQAKTLGNPPKQVAAQGTFTVITLRTRFDESTIASFRGDGLLYPNGRALTLFDDQGRAYSLSNSVQSVLAASQSAGTPLVTPLRPGEAYTTELVFDLPADAKPVSLLIIESEFTTHLVIGHENSPLHRKTRFQL